MLLLDFRFFAYRERVTESATAKATTTINIIDKGTGCVGGGVPLVFAMLTAKRVPVKAEAGTVPITVSGALKVVGTETQALPSQYSMTLSLVKLGFEIFTVTSIPEPKAPLVEMTLTS